MGTDVDKLLVGTKSDLTPKRVVALADAEVFSCFFLSRVALGELDARGTVPEITSSSRLCAHSARQRATAPPRVLPRWSFRIHQNI